MENTKRPALQMRLRPEDKARLSRLAEHYGIPAADVIRMLAKQECDRVFPHNSSNPPAFP